jgi:hypothetical protein
MGMTKEEAAQLGDMSEMVEQLQKEATETQKIEANQLPQEAVTPAPAPAPKPTPAARRSRRAR